MGLRSIDLHLPLFLWKPQEVTEENKWNMDKVDMKWGLNWCMGLSACVHTFYCMFNYLVILAALKPPHNWWNYLNWRRICISCWCIYTCIRGMRMTEKETNALLHLCIKLSETVPIAHYMHTTSFNHPLVSQNYFNAHNINTKPRVVFWPLTTPIKFYSFRVAASNKRRKAYFELSTLSEQIERRNTEEANGWLGIWTIWSILLQCLILFPSQHRAQLQLTTSWKILLEK